MKFISRILVSFCDNNYISRSDKKKKERKSAISVTECKTSENVPEITVKFEYN